jgi:asparagine synthase (glutamine-hydrolysing)
VPLPRGYVALVWRPDAAEGADRAAALGHRLCAEPDWRRVGATHRSALWIRGDPSGVQALPYAAGFLVGDVFPAIDAAGRVALTPEGAGLCRNPVGMAEHLLRHHWGRYIALLHGPPPASSAVLRDPSGQLGCLTWRWDESVDVVVSDLRTTPRWLWPHRLSLNWGRIATFLADPSKGISDSLFDGLESVRPGELLTLGSTATRRALWRPANFVAPAAVNLADAVGELVRRVDDCTAALIGPYQSVVMELSGGLDSAIVAAAAAAAGVAPRVARWLHRVGDRPEGDEQRFAAAVTERLGVPLSFLSDPVAPLTREGLAELAPATWPAIGGADEGRDREELAQLLTVGAQAIVSGQGGDAVFFQMPTPLIMADEVARHGLRSLFSPMLADVARRSRRSVWQVLGAVIADARGRRGPELARSLAAREFRVAAATQDHPWVADAKVRGVSSAKQIQIAALVNGQMLHGDSRRGRQADRLYPLLAQPVVELCLSIAAPDLAGGAFDRPFARAAFADRLPDLVRQRRAKGDMTSYFSRMIAGSIDVLRPLLLDGCLCDAGVLDRRAVEAALDPGQLIWSGGATEIVWAATLESWVRHWQTLIPDSPQSPRTDVGLRL